MKIEIHRDHLDGSLIVTLEQTLLGKTVSTSFFLDESELVELSQRLAAEVADLSA